jgi:hypothetical protein
MPWGVAAAVGGALVGGIASNMAAGTQADAANNATNAQQAMFNTTVANEQPYMTAGSTALSTLNGQLPTLNTPINNTNWQQYMDPGYQFQLGQGQQALQNSQAAGDGAMSGAAMKGLIQYNQNYANTAYSNAFNQYQTQNSNIYSRLANLANLGQNAAAGTGQAAVATGANEANTITGAGNAEAAGIMGTGNAVSGGISNGMGYMMLNNMSGGSLFGGSSSAGVPGWTPSTGGQ